ncbi:MAG: hypothetical protein GY913_18665 [Proteobacteria bacterium]|nr:hypothetical protein [Pseudomonadota bacterium]MCP4918933.1 hypothetical protein [Pseudomonadota bacterium]
MALFGLGLVGLISTIAAVAITDLRWTTILLYVGATGFSLGTFGTHSDTALAYALRAKRGDLPGPLKAELEGELQASKQDVMALTATPGAAWVATIGALLLHSVGIWRLLGAVA